MLLDSDAFTVGAEMMQASECPVVEPEFFELVEKLDRSLRIGHLRTSPGTRHWSCWHRRRISPRLRGGQPYPTRLQLRRLRRIGVDVARHLGSAVRRHHLARLAIPHHA